MAVGSLSERSEKWHVTTLRIVFERESRVGSLSERSEKWHAEESTYEYARGNVGSLSERSEKWHATTDGVSVPWFVESDH